MTNLRPSRVFSCRSGSDSCSSMAGRMSSNALEPTVLCRESNVLAAASLTAGSSSQRAFLTVGTRLSTKVRTMSLEVETMISLSPTHTPCLLSLSSLSKPFSRIGMISGKTLSPSFLTMSPSVLAATCLLS